MKLKASIAIVALAGIVGMAAAQSAPVAGRSFTYSASDSVNTDFSKAGNVTLKSASTVTVDPYLYITGNLSANWTVDGWGVGQDTEVNSVYFYHNETITFSLSNFGNPTKISGTQTGDQSIQLNAQFQIYNNATSNLLYNTGMNPIAGYNTAFQTSGPNFGAADTGGVMRVDFSRQIQITPSTGPGVYQNVGSIAVMRN